MNFKTIVPDKHKYLEPLTTLAMVPSALFIRGELPAHHTPTVAIVGSRKPTNYGREVTRQLAYELANKGVTIVSGLAYGIDAVAHRAALEAEGTTIAVLANAIDTVYPRQHTRLAEEIISSGGAVISEYAPGTPTYKSNFLARNRLVSGLADAIIVTEAAERSGTLSTINHALEQGKDVFAVPGNITSPQSVGCNLIIKQGATPLTSVNDILELFSLTEQTSPIVHLIQQGIHHVDELLQRSGFEASALLQELTLLELDGVIYRPDGQQWHVRP